MIKNLCACNMRLFRFYTAIIGITISTLLYKLNFEHEKTKPLPNLTFSFLALLILIADNQLLTAIDKIINRY